jgi:hypothetical protein
MFCLKYVSHCSLVASNMVFERSDENDHYVGVAVHMILELSCVKIQHNLLRDSQTLNEVANWNHIFHFGYYLNIRTLFRRKHKALNVA